MPYPLDTFSEETQKELYAYFDKRLDIKIGYLRQWLNERTNKDELITNDQIKVWLG